MKAFGIKKEKPCRTSLRLPSSLLAKIKVMMNNKNYGVRDRSKWICESVQLLNKEDFYCELIAEAFLDPGENEVIPLTMDENTVKRLNHMNDAYTQRYKTKMIDQSNILRTAIMYRIIKESDGLVT